MTCVAKWELSLEGDVGEADARAESASARENDHNNVFYLCEGSGSRPRYLNAPTGRTTQQGGAFRSFPFNQNIDEHSA